ncbi:Cof subfamily protein (haloacid dehalogenase superfamily) [Scopulibacillus daqui]|uniref:Cof subfamily protein (Haloacid dehalogenase superfamily) n=1 Tax=Scopulibacillus daqui TaxID=1469162 RepID=A0ABS2Q3N8_9BACL|nr:Cof-type HAD-IIB family hydrolase [Scopulibacillus daqui]MBM7646914.1 Cof subfamily protein (haloacid dehalogenase superfamily) [Scopulibacillus daqui]
MVYRMLALDIDGTLLRSNHKLDKNTRDAVEYAKKKGVAVTLVSERHFHSAAKVAKALKLKYPIITHNGAFVSSSIDNPMYTSKIEHHILLQLVEFLETYPCHIRVSHERLSVSNRPKQRNLIAKMTIGVSEPLFYPVTYVDSLSKYLHENLESATDVKVELYQNNMNEVLEALEDFFPTIKVVKNSPTQLTLTHWGTSKFDGLVHLAQYLGVPISEIVAVGDGVEDIEMIEKVGLGVAMNQAPKEVKEKAKWITRSNDMHGVAYLIREVFRKQMRVHV